ECRLLRRLPVGGCAQTTVSGARAMIAQRTWLRAGLLCLLASCAYVQSSANAQTYLAGSADPDWRRPAKQPPLDHRPRRWRTRRTCIGNHWPPFGAAMPRALRSVAMALLDV